MEIEIDLIDPFRDLSSWFEWIGNRFTWKFMAVDIAESARMKPLKSLPRGNW